MSYQLYAVTVTPLTPLHIGSGTRLLKDYDYAVFGGRTWRINEDSLLDDYLSDDPSMADQLAVTPPAQLLRKEDFKLNSPYFRYVLSGKPRSTGEGAQLMEQLKSVDDKVYLPGSSLKGAIRTALAWHGWAQLGLEPDKRKLEPKRKFAGQHFERTIMGAEPNRDLLRALQVSDSNQIKGDFLEVLNVQVLTPGGLQSPIELESIKPDTPFNLRLKIDEALLGDWAAKNKLTLGGQADWLRNLVQIIRAHTTQRLNDELPWYDKVKDAKHTVGFYRQLLGADLPTNACLLQLGWGTGWGGKTYGNHLQKQPAFMEHIISQYNLAMGKRRKGDTFPKSRRTIVGLSKDKRGRPGVPLGWVLMEMKQLKL